MSTAIQPDEDFQAFLQQGRFMIQRSASSGRHFFYPRAVAPGTGAEDLEWVQASGLATVYSTTVVRVKPPAPSYNVAIVELQEGPRLMSRVEGVAPQDVRIGMAVRARIVREQELAYVVFDPVRGA
jgi:uncharacterized OB-fold protein